MNKLLTKNKYICSSPQETKDLAVSLAEHLVGGDVLLLTGNLGAGKTLFLQGLAQGLGVYDRVVSPTFNILKIYKTKGNSRVKVFCHIDAYRLNSGKDLQALNIGEILADKNMVTAIEWSENVQDIFANNYIKINIEPINEHNREITIDKK
jgi:tRNA threonylcarbamoyladenosine biosynthesis protein TsaE